MKIIALYGRGGCGKTTTLKLLYDVMLKNGFTLLEGKNMEGADFSAVLEKDGRRIGLTTYGDNAACLQKPFELFKKYNCEIAVSAGRLKRTKNGSVLFLEKEAVNSAVIWHEKAIVSNKNDGFDVAWEIDEINRIQAESLYRQIIFNLT
ncbi:MAG: hypothetical protein K2L42_05585 [Clostridia bacterium]|nr:hypothetical protein [Clostridia bacterium]